MENSSLPTTFEAEIKGIRFGLATREEICKASVSDCPISHVSQLSNPFLGLPLETGKCESCGTGEAGQCEGHFGYIELPTPIYHPDHVGELKRMMSLLCLKCLKFKNRKAKNIGVIERAFASCCEDASHISINEAKTSDGACFLELKVPRSKARDSLWNFLEKYGFRYGDMYSHSRPLLPSEVMAMLRKLTQETRKKLSAKGYFPQEGYILQHLPVPPNCLSVPDVSDGISTMSTDYSITLLKKVLKVVEVIKNSRSGKPNFQSHEIEANDLQAAVTQYLQFRGTGKASRDVDTRFGLNKETNLSSTKAWLEKMKTLFIRKGSGFSSRSVITGDPFKGVSEIGLPFEIAQKITFEERVNQHNMEFLQKLVDKNLCLAYRDGQSTYSLREGSKGHTSLRPGQVVHRRIMDGDIVFINRPPTTHKHSLQALSVYIHDGHTVKINPLICGPLSADFDGDCIHLFYPQSLEAKAEVVELFSVEKQLLSSHTGNFNLQLATDSLLSLKILFRKYFLSRATAQQLAMFVPDMLSRAAVMKSDNGSLWTASQILQMTLPPLFDCSGERHVISNSEVLSLDFNREVMSSIVSDIVTSLFFLKGPNEVLRFFNSIQPLLMESLYSEGFSVSLKDFFLPKSALDSIQKHIQNISPLLYQLRSSYRESIASQLDSYLRGGKTPVNNFILNSSRIGHLIDSKSESALSKVVQQIGFLGMQLSSKGKFYSEMLVKDMSSMFQKRYPSCGDYPAEEFGLVGGTLFRGLDPYQDMVHSISSREVIVRSTRGLTEPGTLFKNLMAILRDVVICYDGTVRNTCSNSIIQFEYGVNSANIASEFCAGDPVGVLAATAMSNPAYKAVLDSSASSNSSWNMMKEILLCGVNFKNENSDRQVMLYLKNCDCGRKHCQENTALIVKNHLKKVSLKDTAIEFLIEYRSQMANESYDISPGPVGHIHLNKAQLIQSDISIQDILEKCQDTMDFHKKKKKVGKMFNNIGLSFSECCSHCQSSKSKWTDVPCIQFFWQETTVDSLEKASHLLADSICPLLLQTIIKGDHRVSTANLVWISSDTATWVRSPSKSPKGELALEIILEKEAVKKSGDAWRVLMDSCLPIIHLIDTQRSIPHAIKEVQELLGISCAFEQAVQRLSTSVTTVTKGVLKDHLLLLANSMTCSGTFIGFNAGGIKSLSRSLGVQVPFMNATLFTPRKCFEKAAEKCHVDNLSSIVGSCAWGKHVTVGTGSPFEILLDTRKAELRPDKEIDAYSFLHMVNSKSNPEDMGTSCLGAEIEDLDQEDDFMECDLSPVREPGLDKPTFEDMIEFGLNGDDKFGFSKEDANDDWSSLGKLVDSELNDWTKKAEPSPWGKKVDSEENDWSGKPEQSSWGKKVNSDENDWTKGEQNTRAEQPEDGSAWGKKVESDGGGWGKKPAGSTWGKKGNSEVERSTFAEESQNGSAWGQKVDSGGDAWTDKPEQNTWGNKDNSKANDWAKMAEQKSNAEENQNSSAWGRKVDSGEDWMKKPEQSSWGKKVNSEENDWTKKEEQKTNAEAWGKKVDSDGGDWAKKDDQNQWARTSSAEPHSQSNWAVAPSGGKDWGVQDDQRTLANASEEKGWNKKDEQNSWGNVNTPKTDTHSTWGKDTARVEDFSAAKSQEDGSWSSASKLQAQTPLEENKWGAKLVDQASQSKPSNTWGTSNDWGNKVDSQSPTGEKKESPFNAWGSSQNQSNDSAVSQGWGSPRVDNSGEKDGQSQWGRGRGRGRGRGWVRGGGRGREGSQGRGPPSNDGDWKNKRPRPADDPSVLTVTKQRLDTFPVEEQDILLDSESIMKNIRRVMHQTGYNDGDPISADDQKFIIDNVLNYHPDKAVKMGAGVHHIMVSRHEEFQDSRCLYAVDVDGGKADFSYRKCLENYLREKYPDQAETFIPRYFRKSQPRPGWNKDRGGPPRGDAGTPGSWNNRDSSTPAPDEAGTPGWGGASTPGWAGTQGWNTDLTPGPDAAAATTTGSGWDKDPGPVTDEPDKDPGPVADEPETQAPTV